MNVSVNGILYPNRKEHDIMKVKLQKLIGTAVLGVALFANHLPAWAGVAARKEVSISPSGTFVQGSLTGARYSADSEQFIGCNADSFSSQTFTLVVCEARDYRGRTFFCASTDPRFADAVKGMTDSSDIRINLGNNGTCGEVVISNESIYLR